VSAVHVIAASLGATAELVGFTLVLWESHRVRRTELGRIGRLGRLWLEIKRTFRNPEPGNNSTRRRRTFGSRSSGMAPEQTRGSERWRRGVEPILNERSTDNAWVRSSSWSAWR
jgi:hypothetical protein